MAPQDKFSALKRTILLSLCLAIFQGVSALEIQSRTHHHAVLARAVLKRTPEPEPVALAQPSNSTLIEARALGDPWNGAGWYEQGGNSGINAMQMAPVNDRYVILLDKAEQNPLRTSDGNHAWAAMFDTRTGTSRALFTKTNSFCAGGGWLADGTLISYGGNPKEGPTETGNGVQAIRLIVPKPDGSGEFVEDVNKKLTGPRWYPSSARLADGSTIIFGGMIAAGFNNKASTDNPTIEFFPPKGAGTAIFSPFLQQTLPSNLFPHVFTLPDDRVFVASNLKAMIYNWKTNTEQRLPDFPNGVRVNYPWSAGAVLLPLTPENNYTPEILVCGGSTINDKLPEWQMSSKTPASKQCARMVLNAAGIAAGWQTEDMPGGRLMIDAVLTPDGNVLLMNGAKTGLAGYGNVPDQIGQSNADNPYFTPWLYRPKNAKNSRFQKNFATTGIARMYHSSATLLADGRIMVAGSNPNADVTTRKYQTEYRVEYFNPPYMGQARPSFTGKPAKLNYNEEVTLQVTVPAGTSKVTAAILDLGFHTHGVSLNSRYVGLRTTWNKATGQLKITGPPTAGIYPKGPAFIYVLADGVPSKGSKVMIGDGWLDRTRG